MLPERFTERMKLLLAEETEDFLSALSEPSVRALRINPKKCAKDEDLSYLGIALSPLSYVEGGYIIEGESDGLGNTPSHLSGKFYIQDPGAMSSAAAVDIPSCAWVCDLCAALCKGKAA